MTERQLLRTAPHYWTRTRVDRKNLQLYDVVAMQANVEALGHNCMTDLKSVQMVEQLANQHRGGLGVQGRFGHPGMSENAAGRKVMLSKNFRVRGDKLVHDVFLLEEARKSPVFSQDPVEYILDVAEHQPQELAESLVIDAERVWTFADGSEHAWYDRDGMREAGHRLDEDGIPLDALTPLPVIRPVQLYYLDVVNEGALTHDGLFSSDVAQMMFAGTSSAYADQLFGFIDEFRAQYNVPLDALPDKVHTVLSRYISSRGNEMANKTSKSTSQRATGNRTRAQMDAGTVPADELLGDDEDTTEVDPVPAEDSVDLNAVEADSQQAVEDTTEPEPAPAPEVTDSLSVDPQRYAALEADVVQLKRIVALQAKAIQNLTRQLDEPHVTRSVPSAPTQRLAAQGVPPKAVTRQRPDLMAQQRSSDNANHRPQDNGGLAVLAANQRRGGS